MNLTPEQKAKYQKDLENYKLMVYNNHGLLPMKQRIVNRQPKFVSTEDTSGRILTFPVNEMKWLMEIPDLMEVVNATITSDGKLIKSKVNFQLYGRCYDKSCKEASAEDVNQLVLATLAYMAQQPDTYRKDWVQFLKKNWARKPGLDAILDFINSKNYKMHNFFQLSTDNKDAILSWIYFMLQEIL